MELTEAVARSETRQTRKIPPFLIALANFSSVSQGRLKKNKFIKKKRERVIFGDGGWLRRAAALPLIPRNAFTGWRGSEAAKAQPGLSERSPAPTVRIRKRAGGSRSGRPMNQLQETGGGGDESCNANKGDNGLGGLSRQTSRK